MNPRDIVREYFPMAGPEAVEMILWNHTGYPGFWDRADGATPEQCLRTQLASLKARWDKNNTAGG